MESAISSAAASLPQIEDYVPLNCSFGIKQYCVGYINKENLTCSDTPFDISALLPVEIQALPGPVEDVVRERIGDLSPLAGDLSSLPGAVKICLIVGFICSSLVLGLFCYPAFYDSISQKASRNVRVLIYLSMALACCAPYFVLILLQTKVVNEAKKLPAWVGVEEGEIIRLSSGLLVCAVVLVPLAAVSFSNKTVQWIKDKIRAK